MNILITGLYGFVGSHLISTLKEGNSIIGIDIIDLKRDGVKGIYSWEELERNKIPVPDVIIHLAGKAHDIKNESLAEEYFEINTVLTKKIYDYFLNSTASKFIFFSSVKAVADHVKGEILTEDVHPNPVGPYGESKIAAEKYIQENLPQYKKVYILRPCMIHGPGNKGNLNLLYKVVNKGIPWPLGAFSNKRSFTSIENLCFIIRKLVDKEVMSGIYHIGDDNALSTNEVIGIISEVLERKKRIIPVPKPLIRFFANLGSIFNLPLNNERLDKLTENYMVSNQKIKNAIGITKLPVKAEDGLKETIKSFINGDN